MRGLASRYAHLPVLISGRGDVLNVARQYGFQNPVHTHQLGRAMPSATPFTKYAPEDAGAAGACPINDMGYGSSEKPFAAVMVMTDPDDW